MRSILVCIVLIVPALADFANAASQCSWRDYLPDLIAIAAEQERKIATVQVR